MRQKDVVAPQLFQARLNAPENIQIKQQQAQNNAP
jgi:hypothetical protein